MPLPESPKLENYETEEEYRAAWKIYQCQMEGKELSNEELDRRLASALDEFAKVQKVHPRELDN